MARDKKELSEKDLENVQGGTSGKPSLGIGCSGPPDVDDFHEYDDHLVTPDSGDKDPERH